jgi:hypothetical protein
VVGVLVLSGGYEFYYSLKAVILYRLLSSWYCLLLEAVNPIAIVRANLLYELINLKDSLGVELRSFYL